MQINLILLDKTKTVDYLTSVLNRIEPMFGFNLSSMCERHGNCLQDVSQELLAVFSIRELKSLADSLVFWLEVSSLPPKRNSKISLSRWIVEILLYIQHTIHAPIGGGLPGVVEDSGVEEVLEPDEKRGYVDAAEADPVIAANQVTNSPCPDCGLVHEPGQNTLCAYGDPVPGVEIMEPEEKSIYTIALLADGQFSQERVSRIPPYLLDRKGNLLQRFWHRSCDAGYSEIVSEHLSNISVESGLVIKLMAENLEVSQACICGDPPPFIIDKKGAVYKRDRVKLNLAVRYAQVVSEYLSNIAVV